MLKPIMLTKQMQTSLLSFLKNGIAVNITTKG